MSYCTLCQKRTKNSSHRFPRDEVRFNKWLEALGMSEVNVGDHFKSTDDRNKKSNLKINAPPPLTQNFENFPNDDELSQKWEEEMNVKKITKTSRLCSLHFNPEDYDHPLNPNRLKKGALPKLNAIGVTTAKLSGNPEEVLRQYIKLHPNKAIKLETDAEAADVNDTQFCPDDIITTTVVKTELDWESSYLPCNSDSDNRSTILEEGELVEVDKEGVRKSSDKDKLRMVQLNGSVYLHNSNTVPSTFTNDGKILKNQEKNSDKDVANSTQVSKTQYVQPDDFVIRIKTEIKEEPSIDFDDSRYPDSNQLPFLQNFLEEDSIYPKEADEEDDTKNNSNRICKVRLSSNGNINFGTPRQIEVVKTLNSNAAATLTLPLQVARPLNYRKAEYRMLNGLRRHDFTSDEAWMTYRSNYFQLQRELKTCMASLRNSKRKRRKMRETIEELEKQIEDYYA